MWIEWLGVIGIGALLAAIVNSVSARRNLVYTGRSARREELCAEMVSVSEAVNRRLSLMVESRTAIGFKRLQPQLMTEAETFNLLVIEGEQLLSNRTLKLSEELRSAAFSFAHRRIALTRREKEQFGFRFYSNESLTRSILQEKSQGLPVLWWRRVRRGAKKLRSAFRARRNRRVMPLSFAREAAILPSLIEYLKDSHNAGVIQRIAVQRYGSKVALDWDVCSLDGEEETLVSPFGYARLSHRRRKVGKKLYEVSKNAPLSTQETTDKAFIESELLGWSVPTPRRVGSRLARLVR